MNQYVAQLTHYRDPQQFGSLLAGTVVKRTKSIRGKRDLQKPCNIAFREGLEAKRQGLPRNACPYDGDDSYTIYLRAYWLNGHSSQDGIDHHATEQSQ